MISKILLVSSSLLCLVLLTACVNLKPTPFEAQSFTLGPVEMEAMEQVAVASEPIYIIRPQVPTYLDSTRLSYRLASGEVKNMPGTRWAEPLAEGIARAMSLYLSETSLGPVEGYYPWPNSSTKALRLSLEFQRFGATETGEVQVVVRWTLKRSAGQTKSGLFVLGTLSWDAGQPDALVAAYNQALKALALEIERSLNQK